MSYSERVPRQIRPQFAFYSPSHSARDGSAYADAELDWQGGGDCDSCGAKGVKTMPAEAVLDLGFDGICYRSAVRSGGTNFVFFKPADLTIQPNIRLVEVEAVEVKYREIAR